MGKTKDIISTSNDNGGTVTFKFKDDACGENGTFDPGANQVACQIDGMGRASLLLSQHFFTLLRQKGIPNHFRCIDAEAGTMTCTRLTIFKVEFIWRSKAWGSFCKAYGVEQGYPLGEGLVETTLKDDALGDPRANKDTCVLLGKITADQYDRCASATKEIAKVLVEELDKHNYDLIDFKIECGVDDEGNIILGDEISPASWRILDRITGAIAAPLDAARRILGWK